MNGIHGRQVSPQLNYGSSCNRGPPDYPAFMACLLPWRGSVPSPLGVCSPSIVHSEGILMLACFSQRSKLGRHQAPSVEAHADGA